MLRKPDLYNKAVALWYKGFSYNEILKYVPVAESPISMWSRRIPLTEKQKERLLQKKRNTPLIQKLRKWAIQSKKEAKVWAKEQIDKLSVNKERLLLISGILLYWAEGTNNNGKSLEFTNTDPKMIKLIMQFFREILKIPENKFKIMIRIGEKGDIERATNYWLRITKLSRKNLRQPEILKLTQNSKSLKKHPYGICRIEVHNTSLARKLIALIEEFSKKFVPVAQRI